MFIEKFKHLEKNNFVCLTTILFNFLQEIRESIHNMNTQYWQGNRYD